MASLVDQIFQQSQAGSANGESFFDAYLAGKQGAQRDRQLAMQEQELNAQLAQVPLKMTLQRQEAQLNAEKLTNLLEQRQAIVQNESIISELNRFNAEQLLAGKPENAQAAILAAEAKYPGLWRDPRLPAMKENVNKGFTSLLELQRLRNEKRVLDSPRIVNAVDEKTGRSIAYAETSPSHFVEVAGTGDLTTGTKTKLQEQELSSDEAINALRDAIQGIQAHPGAIGVRGKVGEAVERIRGQVSPTTQQDTPITDVRQKASLAFSRVAPALRVDSGNMSKYELNKLEQAGDVLDVTEAPQTALNKLQNLQDLVVARQLRTLKAQGKPIPDAVLASVSGVEIAGLLASGLLSREDAQRLYNLHRNAR